VPRVNVKGVGGKRVGRGDWSCGWNVEASGLSVMVDSDSVVDAASEGWKDVASGSNVDCAVDTAVEWVMSVDCERWLEAVGDEGVDEDTEDPDIVVDVISGLIALLFDERGGVELETRSFDMVGPVY
jgi:hypothetical protein